MEWGTPFLLWMRRERLEIKRATDSNPTHLSYIFQASRKVPRMAKQVKKREWRAIAQLFTPTNLINGT
jgi:hypothetical protein